MSCRHGGRQSRSSSNIGEMLDDILRDGLVGNRQRIRMILVVISQTLGDLMVCRDRLAKHSYLVVLLDGIAPSSLLICTQPPILAYVITISSTYKIEDQKERLASTDLTNACSMISLEVAFNFFQNGVPNAKELATIFEKTAPKLRYMRNFMGIAPGGLVCAEELIYKLGELRDRADTSEIYKQYFPNYQDTHLETMQYYEGRMFELADRKLLQERVEERLNRATTERCAISIFLNGHTITGCFDVLVRYFSCYKSLSPNPSYNPRTCIYLSVTGENVVLHRLSLHGNVDSRRLPW
jgi:hypothetical protein